MTRYAADAAACFQRFTHAAYLALAYHDPPTTAVLSWSTSPAAVSLREALVVEGIKGE